MFECVHPFFIGLYDYIYICMHMCKHKHRDKCATIMRKKDSCYFTCWKDERVWVLSIFSHVFNFYYFSLYSSQFLGSGEARKREGGRK